MLAGAVVVTATSAAGDALSTAGSPSVGWRLMGRKVARSGCQTKLEGPEPLLASAGVGGASRLKPVNLNGSFAASANYR